MNKPAFLLKLLDILCCRMNATETGKSWLTSATIRPSLT
jgi:hypothetical protein